MRRVIISPVSSGAGKPSTKLLDRSALERSETVANSCMNRERNLVGPNSYEKDLGLSPLELLKSRLKTKGEASWLDLCCGSGRALLQASQSVHATGLQQMIHLTGIDLIPMFEAIPSNLRSIQFVAASIETWQTEHKFDLITCVHGLHYIGDKLSLLRRASS
jgi:trans-aconitate methyltransferase